MTFEEFYNTDLGNLLSLQASRFPDKVFAKLGDKSWTFREVEERANSLANGLVGLEVVPGDRVAVILPNIPEYIISVFATVKAGLIIVPVNVRRNYEEILARLSKTRPKALITYSEPDQNDGKDHLDMGLRLASEINALEKVISVGEQRDGALQWKDLVSGSTERLDDIIEPEETAAIIHTLGSMGEPRGAMLTHQGLIHNAAAQASVMRLGPEDKLLGAVPFTNTFGLTATILTSLIAGSEIVCVSKYSAPKALELIEKEKITIHHGVPTMFAMELNLPQFDPEKYTSLRTGVMSGAPCPPELVAKLHNEMGFKVLAAYGLTEASPGVTMTRLDDGPVTATETVGRLLEGVEIKVVNDGLTTLPPGAEGVLCVRGINVMKGYWDEPEATALVLDADGWLNTGDLAIIDPDGPVKIVGRKGEEIIRGGFKIYPGTIEIKLRSLPGVKEAALVGVPDLIYGELLYACVVRRPGHDFSAEDLLAFAEKQLPDYAQPDRVIFFEALPRRGSGTVNKDYLRERVRIRGHSWKFGKNIDTDAIIPARRCNTADPHELALYCMEDADVEFVNKMSRGDLIVADSNFGCGSSREVAPLTIKAAGVSAVIAKSFARIFFRNAINIGLPILESPEAVDGIQEGDEIEVEPATGTIRNLTRNQVYQAEPFPDFLQKIIDMGGLLPYVEDRLSAEAGGK